MIVATKNSQLADIARQLPPLCGPDTPVIFAMNGAPWWGQLDEGLYASGGCNGSGIAKGTMLGRHLAELILGREGAYDAMAQSMGRASWIAPEPFRTIGFHVVSALESRKAGLEM